MGTWGAGQGRQESYCRTGGGLERGWENWVHRAVQLSQRVADGNFSQDTEGEGEGSSKKLNVGTGII